MLYGLFLGAFLGTALGAGAMFYWVHKYREKD